MEHAKILIVDDDPDFTNVLKSFGTVAKAVPRACDKCHQEGTGQ